MSSITSWTRLEPRARSGDMQSGLEARVHDPLWLLGRQWQLGEFQGEDAGSPVWTRLHAEVTAVPAANPLQGQEMPLEAMVERDDVGVMDCRSAAEAGLH